MRSMSVHEAFAFAPFRLSGLVIGALMNQRGQLAALGDAALAPPYKAPPKNVVLYVKPRNTLVGRGASVSVDSATPALELGACLGLVIGRTACALDESRALDHVAGYLIVADFSTPHQSFYRPSIRFKARDASCVIGPQVVPRARIADPDALGVRVFVDGRQVQQADTGDVFRGAARLLAEVTDFMTLSPGDILMTGTAPGAPLVGAGAAVAIEIDGLGRLETRVDAEVEAAP
ncbi:MAG: fumarylacetoacetate hydrolase family protein [Caldimonas sp.]